MKFRQSPLFFLLLLSPQGVLSQASYGKGAAPPVSNFQRYANEDQAVGPSSIPTTTLTTSPPGNVQASVPTQQIPPKVTTPAAAAAVISPNAPSAPKIISTAAAAASPPPTPAPVKINPISMTTTPLIKTPTIAAVPTQPPTAPPPRPEPASTQLVKVVASQQSHQSQQSIPVEQPTIGATQPSPLAVKQQTEEATTARLAQWESTLKAREEALSKREIEVNDRAVGAHAAERKFERLQALFKNKVESLEEETKSYEEMKKLLVRSHESENAPSAHYEQTKAEMMEALRALKFRNLFNVARKTSFVETHRYTANWLYELKKDLIRELDLTPGLSYSWGRLGQALYNKHFGETRLGFCRFVIICLMLLYALSQAHQLKIMRSDQRALARRQDILLEQFNIMTDEVRRGCFITNRYCENAINELKCSAESGGPASSSTKQYGNPTYGSTISSSRLAEDSLGRADYYELVTDNKDELIHRIFQLLLHFIRSPSQQPVNNDQAHLAPIRGHLLYLEWLLAAHHKDLMTKLEMLDDKIDLVNLQTAAATEAVYNDCVAQIRESTKWLPFLELIEAYVAWDIEGRFRDLIEKFCAKPKDEYIIQQLTAELHKLGGVFECRSQKALNNLDNTSVRDKYRHALLRAQEKFLQTCPCTDISKPPERFERLYDSMDLFRKIVFGILNQLPATSLDISNYVAQVYGADAAESPTAAAARYGSRDDEQQPVNSEQRDNFSMSPIFAQNSREDISTAFALPDPQSAFEILRAQGKPPSSHTEYVELFREQVLAPYLNVQGPPPPLPPAAAAQHQDYPTGVSHEGDNGEYSHAL